MGAFEVETDALRTTATAAEAAVAAFTARAAGGGTDLGDATLEAAAREFITQLSTSCRRHHDNMEAIPTGLRVGADLYEKADHGTGDTAQAAPSMLAAL